MKGKKTFKFKTVYLWGGCDGGHSLVEMHPGVLLCPLKDYHNNNNNNIYRYRYRYLYIYIYIYLPIYLYIN